MFRLHYKGVNSTNEAVNMFQSHWQMIDWIDEKCVNRNGTVTWMTGREDTTDYFISQSHISIQDYLQNKSLHQVRGNYFLFEYECFNILEILT